MAAALLYFESGIVRNPSPYRRALLRIGVNRFCEPARQHQRRPGNLSVPAFQSVRADLVDCHVLLAAKLDSVFDLRLVNRNSAHTIRRIEQDDGVRRQLLLSFVLPQPIINDARNLRR